MTAISYTQDLYENLGDLCKQLENMKFRAKYSNYVNDALNSLLSAKNRLWSLQNVLKQD